MEPEATILTDRAGRILAWDAGAEALYGYTAGEIMGRTIWLLAPTTRSSEVAAAWARVVAGEPVAYESDHLAKGGWRVRVKGTAHPERDRAGNVVGVRGRMQRA